ncbi:MAG: NAD(P)H-hydrate epimerase, partial [Thermoplasmata archaeon]
MLDYIDVKVFDINSEALGVSAETLMENAGRALAHKLLDNFADIENILIVCGTGNNCGDGLVAARYLARRGMKIKIIFVRGMRGIKSELARRQLLRLQGIREITLLDYSPNSLNESLIWCNVVLDAMLGVGISGDVKEPYAGVIDALNKSGKPIIAVDVPSGLGTKSCVKAEFTVTFHDVKKGMSPEYCGKIEVADIGIPKEAELYTGPGEFVYFPRPKKESHKGENGRLLIIGGGPYTGA